MIRHYLRTTLRVLTRHASFSAINLTGLSIGIASALLLLLFVQNEVTFDQAHDKADRIYRAWLLEEYGEDQVHFNTTTPVRLATDLATHIPEVEAAVRFDRFNDTVRRGAFSQNESLFLVDEQFLQVFDFPVVRGERSSMLYGPENIVLTESAASRYFGQANPLGETLSLDFSGNPRQFQVSGVLEDVPENSSLQFEFLVPYPVADWFYPDEVMTAFMMVSPETYVLLSPGTTPADLEDKIQAMLNSLLGDRVEPGQYQVGLQPLLDIHTNPEFPQGYSTVINPMYVRVLLALALLILAVASINFVTLSVSRSLARAKEIGVRKVIGADRGQLMVQYWGEALAITGLSLAAGVLLARLFLPAFNGLAQRELVLAATPGTFALLAGIFVVVGLLAGLYPALVLSRFSPIDAFRGKVSGNEKSAVRRSLVVAQFALSILLIACTLVIGRQLDYLQEKDLGFDRESVLTVPTLVGAVDGKALAERLRFQLEGRSDVKSLTAAAALFDQNGWGRVGYTANDGSYRRHFVNVVDHDFMRTMGLRLVAGRDFDRSQPADGERAVIINEAFAQAYGWDTPLLERLPGSDFIDHEIIGVAENFHYASLHQEIQPALFVLGPNVAFSGASDFDYGGSFAADIAIRLETNDLPATISAISDVWSEAAPEMPFAYSFVDEALDQQYRQEARLSSMVTIGALLSILIAGLGLFGLASLSVARRTKEIGLRKVLGASVAGIVGLFTREFSTLVLAAFVIAAPLAWLGMERWTESFAYRADIGLVPFALALAAALGIMLAAVSSQAIRAGLANPVDSLRDE
ncbi:MAG: ABC transporter permease [Rhodothermales bacterium]|nr:ABC transporter permease [Rhodothermales bacterium]MBO6780670.1 ABC transporter permease [Rhodothermales bacterium]